MPCLGGLCVLFYKKNSIFARGRGEAERPSNDASSSGRSLYQRDSCESQQLSRGKGPLPKLGVMGAQRGKKGRGCCPPMSHVFRCMEHAKQRVQICAASALCRLGGLLTWPSLLTWPAKERRMGRDVAGISKEQGPSRHEVVPLSPGGWMWHQC